MARAIIRTLRASVQTPRVTFRPVPRSGARLGVMVWRRCARTRTLRVAGTTARLGIRMLFAKIAQLLVRVAPVRTAVRSLAQESRRLLAAVGRIHAGSRTAAAKARLLP